jgi:signal transduction histidine kinase
VRVGPAAAGALFLLSLLAWLSSLNPNLGRFDRELQALDDFAKAERGLVREVLTARVGLSRNYDALVRMTDAYDQALKRLRGLSDEGPRERAAIEALAARARTQEDLVERFKSKNALLQNSFAYFGVFSTLLAGSDNAPVAAAATRISAALLHLTLDSSQETEREVHRELRQLALLQGAPDEAAPLQALLAHGGMLLDLVPATDVTLKALMDEASTREQDAVYAMIGTRQSAAQASARQYGLMLYATSLALLGVLVYLGMQLRERAVLMRQRAAFERVIASISTGFINLRHHEIASHVEGALERLAGCVGADRAYFLVPSAPLQTYRWSRKGAEFPPGWPEQAPGLISRFDPNYEGIIHIPRVRPSHSYDTANLLADVGLRGWLCVTGPYRESARVVLGFDAVHAATLTQHGEFTLFRMAFDVIASLVGRARVEQEMERLETNLQQARRMETVGALASGVAHNFNNIIGAILGHAEMADTQARSGKAMLSHLDEIRHAGERAQRLVSQILNFGQRRDKREAVCIVTLVAETKSLLAASLPPHVNIAIQRTSEEPLVFAEAAQLQQVILNICSNAAQAMDEPGNIDIRIESRDIERPMRVRGGKLGLGRYAAVSISDPGHGMDETTLERIFEPFFTTRSQGNGLGLSTARETIVEYGGAIDVKSAPGAGTRFDIWLPANPSDESILVQRGSRPVGRGQGETVLVLQADPERLLRDEEIVAALGYEPLGFSRYAEATAACRAAPGRFDAVLLCQHAWTSAALDVAIELRDLAPTLPIILATASTRELDPLLLAVAGISELVHYPLASSGLSSALSRCLSTSATRHRIDDGRGGADRVEARRLAAEPARHASSRDR